MTGITPLSLRENYWRDFEFKDSDLEFLYNYLLELEMPQTTQELVRALAQERIRIEKSSLERQAKTGGDIYLPKNQYTAGQVLSFPVMSWQKGKVVALRDGQNPDMAPFQVMDVEMENGETVSLASGLQDHVLNQMPLVRLDDPNLDINYVIKTHGRQLTARLNAALEANPDLVPIAGRWFPRSLLVDINIGQLNLAEAVLDMEGGGPLSTKAIMEQIDLPTDVNAKLNEFSFNLALQEDGRFDEVGPAGETLWYLHRLEPEMVQTAPAYLRYNTVEYDHSITAPLLSQLESEICDELEPCGPYDEEQTEAVVSLIFPHWRAGTLPLSASVAPLFPTAYEAPRVRFTFVDGNGGQKISGWVVRPYQYAFGLREWYEEQGLMPGSLVRITRSENPGEVIIRAEKRRPNREWVRTALIGTDGGIVFAMLKQPVTAAYNERMTIAISDLNAIDQIWITGSRQRQSLETIVINSMRELAKLNPQGHVNAQELYAVVNLLRRCPPGPILHLLVTSKWSNHVGDLYFRLGDSNRESAYE